MPKALALCLCLLVLACKSPLAGLKPVAGPPVLALGPVTVEDHSRQLKRIKAPRAGEVNTAQARRAALDGHGRWLAAAFRDEAAACGLGVDPAAPYRLELVVTDLGEIRTKYIVIGIASGVAWGVGTGLVLHNTSVAVGLGGYELLEESAFWIGGSALFSSYSAPAVVEAKLFQQGQARPVWTDTYYTLSGRALLKGQPEAVRSDRGLQLRASLQKTLLKILEDLEAVPGFPKGTGATLAGPAAGRSLQDRVLEQEQAAPGA